MKQVTTPDEPHCFVFLDLEETVIDNWSDGNYLPDHIDAIERFLNGRDIKWKGQADDFPISPATPLLNMKLGLMSWAVYDERDKAMFNERFRPDLERLLKRKFDDRYIWSMDDWGNEVFKHFNKKVSRQDMFDMFSKPEVLFALSRTHPDFQNNTVFLVDDAVEHHLTWKSHRNRCVVELRDINVMRK